MSPFIVEVVSSCFVSRSDIKLSTAALCSSPLPHPMGICDTDSVFWSWSSETEVRVKKIKSKFYSSFLPANRASWVRFAAGIIATASTTQETTGFFRAFVCLPRG